MINKKLLQELDDSQKEALSLLTDNQILLFMKETHKDLLESSMSLASLKNPNSEEIKSKSEKQSEYRTFFFNQSKIKGFNADTGIIKASIEYEYLTLMKDLLKSMFSNLRNITNNILEFCYHYKNFILIIGVIYERENIFYNYPKKFLQEEDDLKNYEKFNREFLDSSLELIAKNSYERSKTLKEEIIQEKELLLLEDMGELYSLKDFEFVDDSLIKAIDNFKEMYNLTIKLLEVTEKEFKDFDKLSEDGFYKHKKRREELFEEDDFKLPSNYIFDMEDFRVKIKAFK